MKLNFAELLKIAKSMKVYEGSATEAPELLKAWYESYKGALKNPDDMRIKLWMIEDYGSMFLFNAGRITGIREERARRNKSMKQSAGINEE